MTLEEIIGSFNSRLFVDRTLHGLNVKEGTFKYYEQTIRLYGPYKKKHIFVNYVQPDGNTVIIKSIVHKYNSTDSNWEANFIVILSSFLTEFIGIFVDNYKEFLEGTYDKRA